MALLSGILGDLFGIGGGMLISPLLQQVGVAPEQVTSATCLFMVLFSSTTSAFQYLLLSMEHTDVALIFRHHLFCGVTSGIGSGSESHSRIWKSISHCILSWVVMALSTVLMTCFGAIDVWTDCLWGVHERPC